GPADRQHADEAEQQRRQLHRRRRPDGAGIDDGVDAEQPGVAPEGVALGDAEQVREPHQAAIEGVQRRYDAQPRPPQGTHHVGDEGHRVTSGYGSGLPLFYRRAVAAAPVGAYGRPQSPREETPDETRVA